MIREPRRPWTREDYATLRARYVTDVDLDALCRDLGRTKMAVEKMASSLGLSRKRQVTNWPITEPELWVAMRNWRAPAPAQLMGVV